MSGASHSSPGHGTEPLARIRDLCAPLLPEPTGWRPRLPRLPAVRAVLFDVYGALFVSGSGEVGTVTSAAAPAAVFVEALTAAGLPELARAGRGTALLDAAIRRRHAESRSRGIDWPEVDIRDVWAEVLRALGRTHGTTADGAWPDPELAARVALEYECRTNPVWPMPGAGRLLSRLRACGTVLGIVSNAQFYTELLFPALLGGDLRQLGFSRDCCAWSYEHGEAKPSLQLLREPLEVLSKRGFRPENILFVGNDRRNDLLPAAKLGLRTALFAGDARSLRWRHGASDCERVHPDVIVTQLLQLTECLSPGPGPAVNGRSP